MNAAPEPATIALSALADDRPTTVMLGDDPVVLIRDGDAVRAFAGKCTHVGAPLGDGVVCEGRLICPWHKAQFDVTDGQVLEPPALLPLTRYAVTIADGIVRVDGTVLPSAAAPPAPADAPARLAVIGTGAAAAAALATFRERRHAGTVTLIGPEAADPYDRTALSKMVISGQQPPASTPLRLPDGALAAPAVARIAGTAVRLDAAARRIHLADGRTIDYDRALVATGGTPKRPDLPGASLDGVHVLRGTDEAASLVETIERARRAVIVGANFIGLEVASGLRAREIETAVLSRHPVPFAPTFGTAIGARLKRLHEEKGVRFVNAEPARIEGAQRVERVVLDNGETLDADLVLLATGIAPNAGFVAGATVVDGALAVDGGMCAADGLFAAGDLARFPYRDGHVRIEHWRLAQQQARVAARNMLGEAASYDAVPYFWTAHHGLRIDYLGHAEDWEDTVIDGDLDAPSFVAYLVKVGRVRAAIGCKRDDEMGRLSYAMRRELTLDEARGAAAG